MSKNNLYVEPLELNQNLMSKQIPNIGICPYLISNLARFIPSETEDGSPGPFEKNIPSGSLDNTSLKEELGGKTKISHP